MSLNINIKCHKKHLKGNRIIFGTFKKEDIKYFVGF